AGDVQKPASTGGPKEGGHGGDAATAAKPADAGAAVAPGDSQPAAAGDNKARGTIADIPPPPEITPTATERKALPGGGYTQEYDGPEGQFKFEKTKDGRYLVADEKGDFPKDLPADNPEIKKHREAVDKLAEANIKNPADLARFHADMARFEA